jgi:hypothetical protein
MAVIDNNWKLLSLPSKDGSKIELYDLAKDMAETTNLKDKERKVFKNLNKFMNSSMISIQKSIMGKDYIEGKVREQPPRIFWTEVESYKKYFNEWQTRPEYKRLKNK